MCLGIPAPIIEIPEKQWAIIETGGIKRKVGLHLVGEVEPGDYVLVHAGYAIEKLDLAEAEETIKLWEELLSIEGTKQAE
ncbi:MAG: HypC/HybG/HupF family hydrogenase formation chaperone [Clostridiales bacterium]|nr:HypC/HybG/HupF family hydrogenase formation chaperone [Clostridiales bacterium]MCF8021807.1 HypC/HybG/HupF family hydrogenase formation chaperone [Clostridiales bacterium]